MKTHSVFGEYNGGVLPPPTFFFLFFPFSSPFSPRINSHVNALFDARAEVEIWNRERNSVFQRAVYSKRVSEQSAINYPSRKCKYSSINLGENYVAVVFFAARGEGINLPRRGLGSGLRGEQFSNYNRSFEVR